MRIFHAILPGSLAQATIKRRGNILSPSTTQAFRAGQTCPVLLSLCFLAAGMTSQLERLFFTGSLSHISSSPLSTMRRPHPIYRPLVFGKSFFHHSSFLRNHRIIRETNWIFSILAFNFSILITVLTAAFQLLLGQQRLNTGSIIYIRFLLLRLPAQGFLLC